MARRLGYNRSTLYDWRDSGRFAVEHLQEIMGNNDWESDVQRYYTRSSREGVSAFYKGEACFPVLLNPKNIFIASYFMTQITGAKTPRYSCSAWPAEEKMLTREAQRFLGEGCFSDAENPSMRTVIYLTQPASRVMRVFEARLRAAIEGRLRGDVAAEDFGDSCVSAFVAGVLGHKMYLGDDATICASGPKKASSTYGLLQMALDIFEVEYTSKGRIHISHESLPRLYEQFLELGDLGVEIDKELMEHLYARTLRAISGKVKRSSTMRARRKRAAVAAASATSPALQSGPANNF